MGGAHEDRGAVDVRDLLDLHLWRAFDVDESGRVLAGYDASGSVQLVEIDADGTRTLLTDLAGSCSGRYVRGRRAVVVEHDLGGDENAQLSLVDLNPPGAPLAEDEMEPLVHDPAYVHHLVDVQPGYVVFGTNRRNGVDFDVVAIDLDTRAERTLYDGGGYTVASEVSPLGREVALTTVSLQPGSTQVTVARTDGATFAITGPDEHAWHQDVHWRVDAAALLMTSNRDREFRNVVEVSPDGTWRWLVEDDEHDLTLWPSPDSVVLLVGRNVDGGTQIAFHDHHGHHVRDVDLPGRGVVTSVRWAPDSSRVLVGMEGPTRPSDLLLLDPASDATILVASTSTEAPPDLLARLVEPTSHLVPTPDGESVPCHVYRPADADPRLAGAVVVNIHGGPEAQAERVFQPVMQALVAAGTTVLVPNVRGSTGYGKRWYSLDDRRLRLDAIADLLALRTWVAEVGGDPERMALYGGSYGGYMVLAGLTMQPGTWRAGVDIVGMSSLVTFLENTSDYRRAVREREYGSLERDRAFLEAISPLTYLDGLDVPLFMVHGANDPRVPLGESEQIRDALRARDVPVEMLVFEDEGHGLAKRANKMRAYPGAIEFLLTHLRD